MINLEERQKQLTEYAESLKGKTLDELEKIESELIAEADENPPDAPAQESPRPAAPEDCATPRISRKAF